MKLKVELRGIGQPSDDHLLLMCSNRGSSPPARGEVKNSGEELMLRSDGPRNSTPLASWRTLGLRSQDLASAFLQADSSKWSRGREENQVPSA